MRACVRAGERACFVVADAAGAAGAVSRQRTPMEKGAEGNGKRKRADSQMGGKVHTNTK